MVGEGEAGVTGMPHGQRCSQHISRDARARTACMAAFNICLGVPYDTGMRAGMRAVGYTLSQATRP